MSEENRDEFVEQFETFISANRSYQLIDLTTPFLVGYFFLKMTSVVFNHIQYLDSFLGILVTFAVQAFSIAVLLVYVWRGIQIGQEIYSNSWDNSITFSPRPINAIVSETFERHLSTIEDRNELIKKSEINSLNSFAYCTAWAILVQFLGFLAIRLLQAGGVLTDAVTVYSTSSSTLPYVFAIFNPLLAVFVYVSGNLSDSSEISFYILLLVVIPTLIFSIGIIQLVYVFEFWATQQLRKLSVILLKSTERAEELVVTFVFLLAVLVEVISVLI